jgi:hypothetical protein
LWSSEEFGEKISQEHVGFELLQCFPLPYRSLPQKGSLSAATIREAQVQISLFQHQKPRKTKEENGSKSCKIIVG